MTSNQQPDDSIPTTERQAELEAAYEANVAAGKEPYEGVEIRTRGELHWVMTRRDWLVFDSDVEAMRVVDADFAGVDLTGAILSDIDLEEANLRGACLMDADLTDANLGDANLSGADLSRALLVGAQLDGANLTGADLGVANLSHAGLCEANLSRASLGFANLSGADMYGANISGASLYHCLLDVDTDLEAVHINTSTSLADVIWNGAPLTRTAWTDAQTLGDEAEARRMVEADSKRKPLWRCQYDYRMAGQAYSQLAIALRSQGMNDAADRYAYRAQLMQREMYRWEKRWGACAMSWLLFLVSGYGYRLWRIFATYAAVVLVFGAVYWALGVHSFPHESGIQALWDSLLVSLSAIHGRATFEQLGAWSPAAWSAAVESVLGIVVEGVFIAMLIQRFFAR